VLTPELVVPVGLVLELPVVPLVPEVPLEPEVCAATTGLSIRPNINAQFRNSFTSAPWSKAPHQRGVADSETGQGGSASQRNLGPGSLARCG